jgi:hypothetical protein
MCNNRGRSRGLTHGDRIDMDNSGRRGEGLSNGGRTCRKIIDKLNAIRAHTLKDITGQRPLSPKKFHQFQLLAVHHDHLLNLL